MTATSIMRWSAVIAMTLMAAAKCFGLEVAIAPILTTHLGIITGLLLRHLVKNGDS